MKYMGMTFRILVALIFALKVAHYHRLWTDPQAAIENGRPAARAGSEFEDRGETRLERNFP